jgi:lipid-binding SYLF domain-containing protein
MKTGIGRLLVMSVLALAATAGHAEGDKYQEALTSFKQSPQSGRFFEKAYGYAIFPEVGKAGLIVGGEHGDGQVYEKGKLVGTATLGQVSVGAQAGAKEYAEIIFFETKLDFDRFTAGEFQLEGNAEATAITLNASASAGTDANTASASTTRNNAATSGGYNKGVAIFTITRGGLLAGVSVGGQRIKFKPSK